MQGSRWEQLQRVFDAAVELPPRGARDVPRRARVDGSGTGGTGGSGSNAAAGDRTRFLGIAAQVMRHILVDRARGRRAAKRGGERVRVTLAEVDAALPGSADKLIEIDEALSRLQALDPRKAELR